MKVHSSAPAPAATREASVNVGMLARQAKARAAPEERKRMTAQTPPHRPSQRRPAMQRLAEASPPAKRGAARRMPSQ